MAVEFKAGLKDVVAVNSSICTVDGERGLLTYRGYDIRDLATKASYEEIVYLLWHGDLPTAAQLRTLRHELAAVRPLPEPVPASMRTYPRRAHPLEALRTAVSVLGMHDPDAAVTDSASTLRKATRLTAQIPVLVATWHRLREGLAPVTPLVEAGTAENFLYCLSGTRPSSIAARTMDMIFILHADHE
ncbi:MAG TPA: citrate/2-methylcitrate synthase, partial [bacterium]